MGLEIIDELNPYYIEIPSLLDSLWLLHGSYDNVQKRIRRVLLEEAYINVYQEPGVLSKAVFYFIDLYFSTDDPENCVDRNLVTQNDVFAALLMCYNLHRYSQDEDVKQRCK